MKTSHRRWSSQVNHTDDNSGSVETLKVTEVFYTGTITSEFMETTMTSKNAAADLFSLGIVVSMILPKDGGHRSVSFLVPATEFIGIQHTNQEIHGRTHCPTHS